MSSRRWFFILGQQANSLAALHILICSASKIPPGSLFPELSSIERRYEQKRAATKFTRRPHDRNTGTATKGIDRRIRKGPGKEFARGDSKRSPEQPRDTGT